MRFLSAMHTTLATAILVLSAVTGLAAEQLDEYGVKGAFVLNFLQFVSWPEDRLAADAPLTICVFNDSPIAQSLRPRANVAAKGHAVRVRSASAISDLAGCHVVYVPVTETPRLKEISARYRGAGLLLISEDQNGDETEAVINLVVVDKRIGFEVNLDVARAQRVQLSSKLIRLARHVAGVASLDSGLTHVVSRPGQERD